MERPHTSPREQRVLTRVKQPCIREDSTVIDDIALDMSFENLAETGHQDDDANEVRQILDSSFIKLKEWLDWRLRRQQEDILLSLRNIRELPSSEEVLKTGASYKQDSEASMDFDLGAQGAQLTKHESHLSKAKTALGMDDEQIWLSSLMSVFDQLDSNRTGSIELSEFSEACDELGILDKNAINVFRSMDASHNGVVDRMEWLHTISQSAQGNESEVKQVREFLSKLVDKQTSGSPICTSKAKNRRLLCILRHDSVIRVVWDMLMMVLLFYISVAVPFALGFGKDHYLDVIENVFDVFFCCDVILNFRTTFRDRDDALVVDGFRIAERYVKSWFLLDFFSSVPWDVVTRGVLPNLSPARLLKVGKIAKVLKLLKVGKVKVAHAESEGIEKLKRKAACKAVYRLLRLCRLSAVAFLVAHWLACFGAAVDQSGLRAYFNDLGQRPRTPSKYLAALYWAMTTISTVGYGDITPETDMERAYAMVAMIIGVSLYGYIVGSVTSIVTDIDIHTHAYHERMELVQSWIDRHQQLPVLLQRRLRLHFKQELAAKAVLDDSTVIKQLSPELRTDASFFLISEHVRCHPVFSNHPNSSLPELLQVLQETHAKAHETIVRMGDPGIGMYILVQGLSRYDEGWKWQLPGTDGKHVRFQHIIQGQSFGEEIIFGLEETYKYTVTTIVDSKFNWISEDSFREHYKNMPELHDQMYTAFLNSSGKNIIPVHRISVGHDHSGD